MSEVTSLILAALAPNRFIKEQADDIVKLAKYLENIPVEAKKSWADLVDEEIDHAQVPSPTIVSDFINENNVEQLIEVISTVWIEAETQSLDITDLDLVSHCCAQLFVKIRKTYPNTPWPLTKAFIFVQHFQPYDFEVQEDLLQLCATIEDKIFDENTLTAEQKERIESMKSLELKEKTELVREVTMLACRKTVSTDVYEKIGDELLLDPNWDFRLRYISTLFLSMANSYVPFMRKQEIAVIHSMIDLSNRVLRDSERESKKRNLVQYSILVRIGARMANTDVLINILLAPPVKVFFDELRDIALEPKSDKVEVALVLAYLDVIFYLALKRGKHVLLSRNTNIMDFLFSCLKNENPLVQKAALNALVPVLEGSPMTAFIGKNRCNALIRQIEVHMNKTWLIKSGVLIRIIGLLSTEFNERLKHLNVVAKYAPILKNRYDGKEVQMDLLRCLHTMTSGPVDNANVIEGITMVHSVPGVFEDIIRLVRQLKEGTDVHQLAFRVLAQLIIPNTAIIAKIHTSGVQKDVRKALLSEEKLHLEAVYFTSQLVQSTFDQPKIEEIIQDFYAPILERLKTAEDVTFIAYALICLSLMARGRNGTNAKQILTCANAKTKNGENVLDILTNPTLLFSPNRDIRCNVFKVIHSLSALPSTASMLVNYGLVPPLVQVALFDVDPCFQKLPCTPQLHALTTLNNIVVYNETVKQTLCDMPLFLMSLQDAELGTQHPIERAKAVLVANVIRTKSRFEAHVANQWQMQRNEYLAMETEFLEKNPEYTIKNTVKKEILMPDDLFARSKPKGPQCNNPVCPNREKRDVKIMNCAGCGKVAYCSKECQHKMWPIHKNYCKK